MFRILCYSLYGVYIVWDAFNSFFLEYIIYRVERRIKNVVLC